MPLRFWAISRTPPASPNAILGHSGEPEISLPSPINALESQGNHRCLKLLVKAIGVRVRNTHHLLVRGPDFVCGTTLQARIRSVDSDSLHLAKKPWMLGVWLQPEE